MRLITPLFALLLSVTLPLFGMEIKDFLSAERCLNPDLLEVSVEIVATGKGEEEVLNALSAVDSGIRMLGIPYRGGSYSVLPRKVWDEKSRRYRFGGFEGKVTYTFRLKDPTSQRRIFELLDNVKRNYPIRYSVRWVDWAVSRKRVEEVKGELKRELLKEAKHRAEEYGKLLGKRCSIKTLSFRDWFKPSPYTAKVQSVITPKREEKCLKVTASVVYSCY